jgi:hypothetical protein
MFLERDRTISGGDMNTSDLSGNESTDGSGMKFMIILNAEYFLFHFRKSNTSW